MSSTGKDPKRADSKFITPKGIAALQPGKSKSDPALRGEGTLQVRRLQSGAVKWYFRHTTETGQSVRLPLGVYCERGINGLSVLDARAEAKALRDDYLKGEKDLRAARDHRRDQAKAKRESERLASERAERQAEIEAAAVKVTLGTVLSGYADTLEAAGKASSRDTRNIIRLHVEQAHPDLWAKPAASITAADLLAPLDTLVYAEKRNTARKLRAYMRAAFARALDLRPGRRQGTALDMTTNPAALIGTVKGGANAGERDLSVKELRAYWRRIELMPAPHGPLLQLHLLTGAQRERQLSRLTLTDVSEVTLDRFSGRVLRLLDGKGRRDKPREHIVPLLPEAQQALEAAWPKGRSDPGFIMSATGGETPPADGLLNRRVRAVCKAMMDAGEVAEPFTLTDLRRTVETRLAAAGVPPHVRAQLQSHETGGVVARHYDKYSYLPEKTGALNTLIHILMPKPAKNVSEFRSASQ